MSKNILIIDDNEPICEVMKDILEMEGYDITVRNTGRDSLEFIKGLNPDLILLDVMLDHGIDGRDICKALKSSHDVNHIPVVMVSASHNLGDALKNYCEPNDFIAKPFDIYDLISTVNKQLYQ